MFRVQGFTQIIKIAFKGYGLSEYHRPFDLGRHIEPPVVLRVFPNHKDDDIHSDRSYLEILEMPLRGPSLIITMWGSLKSGKVWPAKL